MKKLFFLLAIALLCSCSLSRAQTLDQAYLNMHNPLLNGPSCSNVTLASAITAVGAAQKSIYLTKTDRAKVDCTWNILADVVVPSNVHIFVPFGVAVNVAAGVTFTLNGPVTVESPESITGDGTYTFAYPQDTIGRSYALRDCLSSIPVSNLILPSFQCSARIKYGNRSFEVYQAVDFVGPISSASGAYWIGMHWNTTATVAGWTRQTGTKYLWRASVDAPDTPDGMVLIMKVLVNASVIALVGDIRPDVPNEGPVNARAGLFNVARDCVTDDTAALQAVFNNAAWRGIMRAYLPAPLHRDCYYAPGGLWVTYNDTLNFNHPGHPLNLNGLVYDGHLEVFGDGAQYFSSMESANGGSGTVIQGTTTPILLAKSEYNVNGSKNLSVRNLTLKGTGTVGATSYLIDFDAVAGITLENVACKQVNHGGSCIRITDPDRVRINGLYLDGPAAWDESLAGSGRGLVITGLDVDNSGSSIQSVHIRAFDTGLELGNVASGIQEATAHMALTAVTALSCNYCVYMAGEVNNLTFNVLQVNGAHVVGVSMGEGVRSIKFIGGAISGAGAAISNVYIGRDGTEAAQISFDNVYFVNSTVAFIINSSHSLTTNMSIVNSRFHCTGGVGTIINAIGNIRGGTFLNNVNANCSIPFSGTGSMNTFDLWNSMDYTAPELNISTKMRVTGPVGATSANQGMWSAGSPVTDLDFGVVPANDCTAVQTYPLVGVNVNNWIFPIKRPTSTPAKVTIHGAILAPDVVSVWLCNGTTVASSDPAPANYDVIVIRIGP